MAKPAFPDVLKKANWDKQKGIVAKISKSETGIGAGLDSVFQAYNAVPWDKLDDKLAATATTAAQGNVIFADGRKVLNTEIEALRKKALDIHRLAKDKAAEFKSPLLKGPREYLTKMSEGALNFSVISRDETIETLKKFEAIEKNLNDEAAAVAKAVKARTDAAKLIALELVKTQNDKEQVEIATDHAKEVASKLTQGKGPAFNAAEIRKITTGVAKTLSTAQERYKALQSNPTVVSARMAAAPGTNVAKLVAVQSGALWTKGTNDFVAITKDIHDMEQALTDVGTLADEAENTAGTSTKTDEDYLKIAKSSLTSMESLQKDIALAHERVKDCPAKMQEYLDANKKGTMDVNKTKSSGKMRIDEGNKRLGQIAEYVKTAESEIKRLATIPQNLKATKDVKAAIDKADNIKSYGNTCIASGTTAVTNAQKLLLQINALK